MNKTSLIAFLLLLFSLQISAQFGSNRNVTLPRLGIKSNSLQLVMKDIGSFLAEKPNGLHFPVTKIVFSELEDLLCFEIKGIDNSWTELFKFGEMPYGYTVVQNRLFIIVGHGYNKINLDDIFYPIDETKTFSRQILPSTGIERNPCWFFEYKDGEIFLISVADLDILDD